MALYHMTLKAAQRSAGQSATAQAAYRSADEIIDSRTGEVFDYTRKQDVSLTEIIGFEGTREALWNEAEQAERRKDAVVSKEYELALQVELSPEQNLELLREYAHWLRERYGPIAVDICIHDADGENPHCHFVTTTRTVDEEGNFNKRKCIRDRSGTERAKLGLPSRNAEMKIVREAWADIVNRGFERAEIDASIDHRSLADQGIDRAPTQHRGPKLDAMRKRGIVLDTDLAEVVELPTEAKTKLADLEKEKAAIEAEIIELDARRPTVKPDLAINPDYEYSGPEDDDPPPEGESGGQYRMDRTYLAIRKQLEAMGCEQYEVGISNPETGSIPSRVWNTGQVLKSVGYLKSQNMKGSNIFIRPAGDQSAGLIMVDDLSQAQLGKLEGQGLKPALSIETSPQNYQAWVRVSDTPLDKELANEVSRTLMKEAGGDPGGVGWRQYGRLAGFTNRKPHHVKENGQYPWVLCRTANGHKAEQAEHLVQACQQSLAARETAPSNNQAEEAGRPSTSRPSHIDLSKDYDVQLAALQVRYDKPGQQFDHSRADFMICKNLLKRGAEREALTDMLEKKAERKGDHRLEYAKQTIIKASSRLDEERRQAGLFRDRLHQNRTDIDRGR